METLLGHKTHNSRLAGILRMPRNSKDDGNIIEFLFSCRTEPVPC